MLGRFDRFCRTHNLRYSAYSGTLLGAVRHKGFIPWDDDIDLGMARPEIIRLIELADELFEETGMRLSGHLGVPLEITPILKVFDEHVIVKPKHEIAESYIWLDVFCIDALPASDAEVASLYKKVHFCHRAINFLASTPESGRTVWRRALKHVAAPLRGSKGLMRLFAKRLTKLATALPYGSTPYVGNIAWGLAGVRERINRDAFEPGDDVDFCNMKIEAMNGWNKLLVNLYGCDYMQMPPVEKRTAHGACAWMVDSDEA